MLCRIGYAEVSDVAVARSTGAGDIADGLGGYGKARSYQGLYVMENCVAAVLPLPALSWATPAATLTLTTPLAVGVTLKVYVVPLPLKDPALPLVTTMSLPQTR